MPPEEVVSAPLSKKSLRQQELARQKEARMAEEAERAADKRQRREERAAKQAASDRDQEAQEAQRKVQVEEYHRLEDMRKIQEAEKRAKEQEEKRLRSEADLLARAEIETRMMAEPSSYPKVQADQKTEAKIELRTKMNAISPQEPATTLSDGARADPRDAGRKGDQTPTKEERPMNGVDADASNSPQKSGMAPYTQASVLSNRNLTDDQRQEYRRLKLKEKRKEKWIARKLEKQSSSPEALEKVVPAKTSIVNESTIKKSEALVYSIVLCMRKSSN